MDRENEAELPEIGIDRRLAAAASRSKLLNRASQPGPSSARIRRLTNGQPIGGAADCNSASSAAKSAGTASGMVAIICATFMIGPLRPPKADFSSRAVRSSRVLMPKRRPPATRAAMPPTPAPTCA